MPQQAIIIENQQLIIESPSEDAAYWDDILRVFRFFEKNVSEEEVRILVKGLSSLGSPLAILEAVLFAEEEQEKRHKQGKPLIENFRGFIIAGIPRGLGKGILEQKELKNKQAATQKAREAQALQLNEWKAQADDIIEQYRAAINEVIRTTATDAEKENVAEILRGQSSIYHGKTVDDFRNKMFIHAFISKFIEVYADRFMGVKSKFDPLFDAVLMRIKTIEPSFRKKLFY